MLDVLFFVICFIAIIAYHFLLQGEDAAIDTDIIRPRKKQAMEERSKKTSLRATPHTERSATGRNWEIFKSSLPNTTQTESTFGKENHKKKFAKTNIKLKRKTDGVACYRIPQMLFKDEEVYDENKRKLTKEIAMDCEMVGIGDGTESMIARVSLVNRYGYCVYDKYVKAREPVQDYRTKVSGILPHHLQNGEEFSVVQKEVAEMLKGRILVGHAIKNDLDVLFLSHPRKHMRDTSKFKAFVQLSRGFTPSLKRLAHELLGKQIQIGEHSSVEDARATMQLYVLYKSKWESEVYRREVI